MCVQPSPESTTTPVSRPPRSYATYGREAGIHLLSSTCQGAAHANSSAMAALQCHLKARRDRAFKGLAQHSPALCALLPPSWHTGPALPAPRCAAPAHQRSQTCRTEGPGQGVVTAAWAWRRQALGQRRRAGRCMALPAPTYQGRQVAPVAPGSQCNASPQIGCQTLPAW